jgi:microcystin-dependent protein
MAFDNPPAYMDGTTVDGEVMRRAFGILFTAGGGIVTPGDLTVAQQSTPNMSVQIGIGQILVPGSTTPTQGLYYSRNGAALTQAINAANATNPRVDTILAQVQDLAYAGGAKDLDKGYVPGAPTPGVTVPPTTAAAAAAAGAGAVPVSSAVLAYVLVPAAASSIVTADIANVQKQLQISGNVGGAASGDLKLSAAATAPPGWLPCDGSAIGRTAFPDLFTAIGTAYGPGDGSTTFNVPDFRGRTIIGAGTGSGLTARSRGQAAGEESHPLISGELASHAHTISDSGHSHSFGGFNLPVSDSSFPWVGTAINPSGADIVATIGGFSGADIHNITNDAGALTGITGTNSSGSGTAHNNMQPYGVANVFIKT